MHHELARNRLVLYRLGAGRHPHHDRHRLAEMVGQVTSAGAYYYKAVKSDGTDFRTGRVQWAPPDGHEGEWIVRHPTAKRLGKTATNYLSVATTPTDCTGMKLRSPGGELRPPRLLLVEHTGRGKLGTDKDYPNKRTGLAFRYVDELDGMLTLGPQAEQIVALIERAAAPVSPDEKMRMATVWAAVHRPTAQATARAAAWTAAWVTARSAARTAAWDAISADTWGTAQVTVLTTALDAAHALVVRDVLAQEHYDTLT